MKLMTVFHSFQPYDYKSVMHYGKTAFSSNNQNTIVRRDGQPADFGRDYYEDTNFMSDIDIQELNDYFNCGKDFHFLATTRGKVRRKLL